MNRFIESGPVDVLSALRQSRPSLNRATTMRMVKALGSQVVVRGAARRPLPRPAIPLRGHAAARLPGPESGARFSWRAAGAAAVHLQATTASAAIGKNRTEGDFHQL